MRKLWRILFQLVILVVVFFLLSSVTVVMDGLTDRGAKADVALVTGHVHPDEDKRDALLDRVVELYKTGKVGQVMVVGATWRQVGDEDAETMVKYLTAHGVPEAAIIQSNHGGTTDETSRAAAELFQARQFESMMVVADYYDVSRLKIALRHEGVLNIESDHVGAFRKEDVMPIGGAVVKLYGYVGREYLMPAAEKMKQEAQVGMDKASADAKKAKEKVDKGLDGLAK